MNLTPEHVADTERDMFEAWARKTHRRPGTHFSQSHNGVYTDNRIAAKWAAWQARAALASPVGADVASDEAQAERTKMVRKNARLSIQLQIIEDLIDDPKHEYDTGTEADYTTPLTNKVHAFVKASRAADGAPAQQRQPAVHWDKAVGGFYIYPAPMSDAVKARATPLFEGRPAPVSGAAEPKLILALPDYEKRRIVIASDEVIDGERLVCVAIEDEVAGVQAPSAADLAMLRVPLPDEVRNVLEKKPGTMFVYLADVEALFALPSPQPDNQTKEAK